MNYSRHKDILGEGIDAHCLIIGVGSIGRQLALQLTCMGVKKLTLIDFDEVEDVNLAVQGYNARDIGRKKVVAVKMACHQINREIDIAIKPRAAETADFAASGINCVFFAVDSIMARTNFHNWMKESNRKLPVIDGRMSSEVCRVLTYNSTEHRDYYETTLFSQDESFSEPCTQKSTIYCANIAAGLMAAQFRKIIFGHYFEPDIIFSIFSTEIQRLY